MTSNNDGIERVVLVTGAGGGLGRQTAEAFAEQGDMVACVDISTEGTEHTVAAIAAAGGRAQAFQADISDPIQIDQLVEDVHRDLGPVSVLANVAGIIDRRQLRELDMEAFARVLSINLTGTYGMIRAFESDLRSVPAGRIVNVASQSGTAGYEFPAYSTSKAAVIHLTKALMLDFWGTAVRINAVSPGPMNTPMLNKVLSESFQATTPTGRISEPREVAEVIRGLAATDQVLINGQNILVDGGATSFFRWTRDETWQPPYPAEAPAGVANA